jgi:hypothetical protein
MFRGRDEFTKRFVVCGSVGRIEESELLFVDETLNAKRYCELLEDRRIVEQMKNAHVVAEYGFNKTALLRIV